MKYRDINLTKLDERFFDDSSMTNERPSFVLITGGVGAGKTTLRKQNYSKGHVVIDGGEIFGEIVDKPTENVEPFLEVIDMAGTMIANRAIREKRNIVMEFIGNNETEMRSIIEALVSLGYDVHLEYVACDVAEAYKRHVKAVNEDYKYLSCFFTKDMHKKWILETRNAIVENLD